MKVLLLVHHSLVPPSEKLDKSELEGAPFKTEYDVYMGLVKAGYKVAVLGVDDELKVIREAIDQEKPKIVFNLLEEFAGEAIFDQNVVSYLELMGIKYTGCNPRGLMLSRDKALAKKILSYHRIPTPKFFVINGNRKKVNVPKGIKYPLFVKSLTEDASFGITQESIVSSFDKLSERLEGFKEKFNSDLLVEEYVNGREIYVSVMGNQKIEVFPPTELIFEKVGERTHKVATSKVKWDLNYRKKYGIKNVKFVCSDRELMSKIERICRRTYKRLNLSGYARVDLRITDGGEIFVIEVNPNPDIAFGDEFSDAASLAGYKYPELLKKIIRLGLSR